MRDGIQGCLDVVAYVAVQRWPDLLINYTNPVDSEALKEAITVKLDGEVAEGVTVNVETPDKYTAKVSFEGMNVKKATTYSVEIAEFKDQYLSTAEGKTFTVTTAPEFVATANPEVFEGFKAGTERTVEFTFTSPLGTDVDKLFVVKDSDGNVKTGWSATLSSKNKVATVSLKDLDATGAFPYTLTVAPDVKNAAGKTILLAGSQLVRCNAVVGCTSLMSMHGGSIEWLSDKLRAGHR